MQEKPSDLCPGIPSPSSIDSASSAVRIPRTETQASTDKKSSSLPARTLPPPWDKRGLCAPLLTL